MGKPRGVIVDVEQQIAQTRARHITRFRRECEPGMGTLYRFCVSIFYGIVISRVTRSDLDTVNGFELHVPCSLVVFPFRVVELSVTPCEGVMLRVGVMAKVVFNMRHARLSSPQIEVDLCCAAAPSIPSEPLLEHFIALGKLKEGKEGIIRIIFVLS